MAQAPQEPSPSGPRAANLADPALTRWLYRLALLLTLCGLVLAAVVVEQASVRSDLEHQRAQVLKDASLLRARLEGQLGVNLQTVQGLVAAIKVEPHMDQARFEQFARPLFNDSTQLRNIGGAPDMIIRLMYPLAGNERALGLDLTALPEQRDSAERARDTGVMVVAGPVKLVQGGTAFVGRIPVTVTDEDGDLRFWGVISAVIDADQLYRVSGLLDAHPALDIALRGADGAGQFGAPFFGPANLFRDNPVLVEISLPSGRWQLAAAPRGGWQPAVSRWQLRLIMAGVGALILLPTLLAIWQMRKNHDQTTRLQGLFSLSPIGIALNDLASGQFIDGNDALVTPTGYTRAEFSRLSFWDLTPREYQAQEEAQLDQLQRTGRYGPYQKEYIRKDGSRYPVQLNGILIRDRSGRELIWSMIEDISLRRQAEQQLAESRQQLELVIDSTGVGFWDWDIPSGATAFNERWAEIIGYRLEELAPVSIATWKRAAHPDDLVASGRLLEAHWRGEQPRFLCRSRMRHKQGHWVWVLDTGRVVEWLPDGKPKRMVGTHLDISEQVEVEQQLMQARDAAEAAARAKSEFLATMSHEIRTPMNGVLGMLNLLQRAGLEPDQQRKADIARTSAESLLALLNDILDFSKVDAGKMDLEELDFDLRCLLGELAEAMALRAQEKGLELVLDLTGVEPSMVRGDPGRVRQIFTNLVGNAIKFTHSGEILIRARLEARAHGLLLRGSVTDSGIGIAPERIPELFAPFTQGDASTTRQYGGTGLGLAICKKICELMQGDISATSKPGSGSCFSFSVLLQPSVQIPPLAPRATLDTLHILIVDDNRTNRDVLRQQLRIWGATVTETGSAQAALERCAARVQDDPARYGKPYDMAILDMVMPAMDGADLGRALKADPRFSAMPLVMMTSIGHRGDGNLFAELGFSAYFAKPVTTEDLLGALAVVAEGGAALRAAQPLVTRHYVKSLHAQEPGQRPPWPTNTRLLLVEDNAVNQEVAKLMLADLGLTTDVAADGREALQTLVNTAPADAYTLILMDCQMPELDGFATTGAIRAGEGGEHHRAVPILAMTANAMKGDREKCLAAGMNGYLSKPVNADALARNLRHWLLGEPLLHTEAAAPEPVPPEPVPAETGFPEPVPAAPVPLEPAPVESDCWDEAAALAMLKGRRERLATLVELFCTSVPERIAALEAALAEHDAGQIARLAHAIKGSAGQLRAKRVDGVAGQLEQAARAQDWEQIPLLTERLVSATQLLVARMQSVLPPPVAH